MKDLKISKELLGEVLGYEVDAFLGISENEIDYTCCRDKDIGYEDISINIYEFAFKCKEKAFKKGYIISSGLTPVLGINKDGWAEVFSSSAPLDGKLRTFKQLSEPEAIFKACKWILDQRTNKCIK